MVLTGATADVRLVLVWPWTPWLGTVRNTEHMRRPGLRLGCRLRREDIALIPGYQTGWENDLRGALTAGKGSDDPATGKRRSTTFRHCRRRYPSMDANIADPSQS